MIDQGGAMWRERDRKESGARMEERIRLAHERRAKEAAQAEATVIVKVTETHDGEDCGCVDQEMTLRVGETVELTHTCHDGRVDKVMARVVSINPAQGPEHGSAAVVPAT